MEKKFRCIVTERGENGKSFISEDREVGVGPLGIIDFWETEEMPASLHGKNLLPGKPTRLEASTHGTLFRFFEIPPFQKNLSPEEAEKQAAEVFASVQASHCRVDTRLNPMMHTTRTIDYVVLLKGEVTLLLDKSEVKLKPFDVVVQRGTNHYWINYNTEPALLMGVLLDAK
ncbi:cupin domain-containing protein [Legionella anisa]|uniref:Cupin domain-containing protein n=1 Tax=Legionella anisa TaxID=28082 RepID=A0AAX0WZ13_9GAMM|nr:cupin domain-containing protein [Legionella anisa]AWN73507.1 cupin domain-containing protein [Legionella anisa]KTC70812.1 hypothetical protein Lani_2359 [Legionella anisa]MCW8426382.1 cupin domain-containing protein [Legionella anisa]MCW8448042.1 cupin domain-containing protein [Legionella anisa]PNL62581.1 cupin domain-containing protein [Legionella anisa]